jgi:hypothetical protein
VVSDSDDEHLERGVINLIDETIVTDAHPPPIALAGQLDRTRRARIGLEGK